MKNLGKFFGLLVTVAFIGSASAQTIAINIVRPLSDGQMVHDALYVAATTSSTYEIQSVHATVGGQTTGLVFSSSAWTNCPLGVCNPMPGWAVEVPLAGLPWGTNILIVTAIDALGNSNSVQRAFVLNRLPTMTSWTLPEGTVARPEVSFVASASDDDPAGVTIDVFRDRVNNSSGVLLASGTNSLNTTLSFAEDGGIVPLTLRVMDSLGQARLLHRRVYVQSSSNLVEIANVSEGQLVEAQNDRLLFRTFSNHSAPPEFWTSPVLKIKTLATGSEGIVFARTNMHVGAAYLSPDGATLVASASPYAGFATGYGLFQVKPDAETLLGTHGLAVISLQCKGDFAAWGWGNAFGFSPQLFRTDLQTSYATPIPNDLGDGNISFDLAANGDVVFAPGNGFGSHSIYRFRNGTNTLLATITGSHFQSTNQLVSPKTDGSNVFYIQITPTNQMLKKISAGGEVKLAEGLTIGSDYLINNGWVVYGRNSGGQTQVWRCSPAGTNTQLTFYGTSSALAAVSPDGEVAFYNNAILYISKGVWPPTEIAAASSASGLTVLWQEGRWLGMLGRSLFQIYTGAPQLLSPTVSGNNLGLGLVGPKGKYLVIECTTNLVNWQVIATNYITDGSGCQAYDPIVSNVLGKMYRLRLQ